MSFGQYGYQHRFFNKPSPSRNILNYQFANANQVRDDLPHYPYSKSKNLDDITLSKSIVLQDH